MGIASFVMGLLTLLGACVNLIPGLGWANYLLCPLALIGALAGLVSLFVRHENKVFGGIGLALNSIAILVAVMRLLLSLLGGGFGVL